MREECLGALQVGADGSHGLEIECIQDGEDGCDGNSREDTVSEAF